MSATIINADITNILMYYKLAFLYIMLMFFELKDPATVAALPDSLSVAPNETT
jgi:hypothetical protein